VWAWHARPGALERLTPPWLRVEVLERGALADGTRTVLRVRAGPVPVRWVAEHRDVVEGRQFVDRQVEGPFEAWIHTHQFTPRGTDACEVTDRVEYSVPAGAAGGLLDRRWIRRQAERTLGYRHTILRDDLDAHARAALAPLHVALTGASGLIGSALVPFLTTGGHRVTRLVRRPPGRGELRWDPAAGALDPAGLEGLDAVVHLAGENVGAGRWTAARRRRIRSSRIEGTALLARTLARLARRPRALAAVSGVGIYGDRGAEPLPDGSAPGPTNDFLAEVTQAWERAAEPARDAGIRVAQPRLGAVLSPRDGALAKLLPLFRVGAGGRIGNGRQWLSWLAVDDAVGIIHHALAADALAGPFNAVAPDAVTNAAFTATLGRVLGRPALLPVPSLAVRAVFGEMAEATILASQRAVPTRLIASGYRFRHPRLEGALRFLLGR